MRRYITQPKDWWEAFEEAARRDGMSVSAWLGMAGKNLLSYRVKYGLSRRRKRGRQAGVPQGKRNSTATKPKQKRGRKKGDSER